MYSQYLLQSLLSCSTAGHPQCCSPGKPRGSQNIWYPAWHHHLALGSLHFGLHVGGIYTPKDGTHKPPRFPRRPGKLTVMGDPMDCNRGFSGYRHPPRFLNIRKLESLSYGFGLLAVSFIVYTNTRNHVILRLHEVLNYSWELVLGQNWGHVVGGRHRSPKFPCYSALGVSLKCQQRHPCPWTAECQKKWLNSPGNQQTFQETSLNSLGFHNNAGSWQHVIPIATQLGPFFPRMYLYVFDPIPYMEYSPIRYGLSLAHMYTYIYNIHTHIIT